MDEGCLQWVFDEEHYEENKAIWEMYGSELAGNFGKKLCGKPVVWGDRCEEHKVERRSGKDRRQHANGDS